MKRETLIFLYILLNAIPILLFGLDKYKAIKRKWRIPEHTLLTSALFGPFGAMLSMFLFRHKIRNKKFILLISFFVLLHIICIYMKFNT